MCGKKDELNIVQLLWMTLIVNYRQVQYKSDLIQH